MTTHKIDPEMVNEVLKLGLDIDGINNSINTYDPIIIEQDYIAIVPNEEYPEEEEAWIEELYNRIDGSYMVDYELHIDIHRFKDMAIEWCAKRNYIIERVAGCVVAKRNWEILEEFIYGGSKPDYPNMLSAELAAISFAWEQIQEEKTNER